MIDESILIVTVECKKYHRFGRYILAVQESDGDRVFRVCDPDEGGSAIHSDQSVLVSSDRVRPTPEVACSTAARLAQIIKLLAKHFHQIRQWKVETERAYN